MTEPDIYYRSQALNGCLIDSQHDPKLRAIVHRDGYDNQSYGRVEAWTTESGWQAIRFVPIDDLTIAPYSYTYGNASNEEYVNEQLAKRGMKPWREAIADDLTTLIAYGREFFA